MCSNFNQKYRPRVFEEVVGQKQAIIKIVNLFETGFTAHCIFFGPYGVGKSALVKIIASEFNERFWKETFISQAFGASKSDRNSNNAFFKFIGRAVDPKTLDRIELLTRTVGRRVVFIDEADYVSKEAQQRLRTIIGGSRNATFILASNDLNKISNAIKSRTVPIQFYPLTTHEITQRLIYICTQETLFSVPITHYYLKNLERIAQEAEGDLRNAINVLQSSVGSNGLEF